MKNRVLIVDDEAALRFVLREGLLLLGYKVAVAANAEEAMSQFMSNADIDVVFSDYTMPGVTGADFHRRIAALLDDRAGVFILMDGSAYKDHSGVWHPCDGYFEETGVRVLPKPFNIMALRDVIAEEMMKVRG